MATLAATTRYHKLFTVTIYHTIIINIIMVVLSKSFFSNRWYQIDEEWAAELIGLRMKVRGSFWNGCTEEEKGTIYGGVIKAYNHDKRRWLNRFKN